MRSLLALLLLAPLGSRAQSAPVPRPPEKVQRVEKVSEHVSVVFGKGGNVGVYVGEREAVVVDSQVAASAPGLLEAIASITDRPVRFLVNTHHHPDHVGGNAALSGKVGEIVAHAAVRRRMEADQARLEPAQRGGLPTVVVGEDDSAAPARLDLRLPGLDLHLVHRGPAHTDGDLVVGMPAEHVLQMGDLLFLGMLPFVDVEGGGSFEGLLDEVTWLVSWIPDDVRIIPGHGPLCGKKELVRYRDLLAAVRAHARANPGLSSAELAARFDQAAWPEWKPMPTFVTWETLFDAATGRGPGRVARP
ncbi:MAG TPA: MBL fold metallo-hydrolase [Anaeromyxobacter sp.]|nr:MBL fold metallo-hydrolase [Anaeromyxobacter sp.]